MAIPLILPEVQAVILTGGHSRRMGQTKAFLEYRGNSFVAHLLAQLQPQVSSVMIAAGQYAPQFVGLGVDVVTDTLAEAGPLAGLANALQQANRPWLLCVPCDNPLLPPDYAARLLQAARVHAAPLVFVRKHGRAQPLYAILQTALLENLQAYLQRGERKVLPWYESVGVVALDWDDAGLAFNNLNSPDDYAAFLQAAQDGSAAVI